MSFLDDLTPTNIATIITAIAGLFSLLNKKVREFFIRQLTSLKDKSETIRDTSLATDETIDLLQKRVNSLASDFVELQTAHHETQKEIYKLRNEIEHLKSERANVIDNKCNNNCFDV